MSRNRLVRTFPLGRRVTFAVATLVAAVGVAGAQEPTPLPANPAGVADARPLPINLPTALQLAGVNPLDIAVATERLRVASAQYDRARVLWLPNLNAGVDYFRHDGQIQDIVGTVFTTSRSSVLFGGGPTATGEGPPAGAERHPPRGRVEHAGAVERVLRRRGERLRRQLR